MIQKYPLPLRVLHWCIAALIFIQIGLGFIMEDIKSAFTIHIVTGLVILFCASLRLATLYRKRKALPGKPPAVSDREWKIVTAGHAILYFLLFATPLSGLVAYWYGSVDEEDIFHQVHVIIVWAFIIVISGHVLVTIKHIIFDQENPLKRMT